MGGFSMDTRILRILTVFLRILAYSRKYVYFVVFSPYSKVFLYSVRIPYPLRILHRIHTVF